MSTKIVEAQTLSGPEHPILLTIFRGGSIRLKDLLAGTYRAS
jgi:hypothetical protein